MSEKIIDVDELADEIGRLQTYKMFCEPDAEKLVSLEEVQKLLQERCWKATPITRCRNCIHFKPLKDVVNKDGSIQKIGCCGLWDRVKGRYFPTENNLCSEACKYDNQ